MHFDLPQAFGLLGAVNDAHAWADLLKRRFGFAPEDITLLCDGFPGPGRRKEKAPGAERGTICQRNAR